MKGCPAHKDAPSILCKECGDLAAAELRAARENEALLQFFEFAHLPEAMQLVSKEFHGLAHKIVSSIPRNPERTVALRKLLEAKDCAVRATIFK